EPRAALADAAAHRPDVIVLDAPLWDRTAPDAALADLSDTVRALPSLFGLQTLAAEIGYRVHSNGGLHLLTRDPPRKLALKTIAEMVWKFASEEYFGEAVKATRARRTEQAALWRRRAQGADAAEVRALRPLPRVRRGDGRCRFVIEGSFYHLSSTSGIARVWANIFAEWRKSGFLDRVVLLDRAGTAPPCEGLARIVVEPHHYSRLARDPALMQAYCDDLEAAAFCSTYYARPLSTPTMALIHDMIPEVLGFDLEAPMWREKHGLIRAAARFVCVSENTRRDLLRVFPEAAERPVAVASPAIAPEFLGPMPEGADALLRRHALDRDYLVFLGSQTGYKGADVLVEAVARLPEAERPLVVFVGDGMVQPRFIDRLGYVNVRGVSADDRDLRLLLSNALAYVNPSYYEGFGLPLLEAMASGCPVIAANAGAMPEVAGDAAILFQPGNPEALAEAIRRVSDLRLSSRLVMSGYERIEAFSWDGIAAAVRTALEEIADGR
ncbi:MAG: glycosyltransferase family 4 protein, partial [Rhodospirillaceae bacterium]